jgi:uncharacterized protein
VTAFGAFVDLGVHQDGLIHVSQLADRFVKDPSEVVKVGDKVNVRVLEVDLVRRRIALTRKSGSAPGAPPAEAGRSPAPGTGAGSARRPTQAMNTKAPVTSKPAETFRNNPFAKHFRK